MVAASRQHLAGAGGGTRSHKVGEISAGDQEVKSSNRHVKYGLGITPEIPAGVRSGRGPAHAAGRVITCTWARGSGWNAK